MRGVLTLAAIFSVSMFSGAANAACVEKTPREGATLIAVVTETDKQAFISAGFEEVACPAGTNVTQAKIDAACGRFDAYRSEDKSAFQQLYGITTAQYCTAAQNYLDSL